MFKHRQTHSNTRATTKLQTKQKLCSHQDFYKESLYHLDLQNTKTNNITHFNLTNPIKDRSKSQNVKLGSDKKIKITIMQLLQQNSKLKQNNYSLQKQIALLKIRMNQLELQIKQSAYTIKNSVKNEWSKYKCSSESHLGNTNLLNTMPNCNMIMAQTKDNNIDMNKCPIICEFDPDFSTRLDQNRQISDCNQPVQLNNQNQQYSLSIANSYFKKTGSKFEYTSLASRSNSLNLTDNNNHHPPQPQVQEQMQAQKLIDQINKTEQTQRRNKLRNIDQQSLYYLQQSRMARSRIQKIIRQHRSDKSRRCMYQK